MQELIERLRDSRYLYNAGLFEACGKAADALESQAAEIERLTKQRDELLLKMQYIEVQTHLGHIQDTASAAIASVKGQA